VLEQFSGKQSSPLMETAGKQFSPFMELLVQLCLTVCATVSYYCATVSYYLCKWLARSFPIYGNGFRGCTSENQGLHKKLSNSKIGLHTDLGNSRTEKASLKQELVELRSQLETERANREKIGAELSDLQKNSASAAELSQKLTSDATTILSQLARQAQKIPGITC